MTKDWQLNYLTVSFIWNETFDFTRFTEAPVADFQGGAKAFVTKFQAMKKNPSQDPFALQLPWQNNAGYHFWRYYLGQYVHDIGSNNAAKKLVPFRRKAGKKIYASSFDSYKNSAEVFYYPFGLSAVVTLRYFPCVPLFETANDMLKMYYEDQVDVTWEDNSTEKVKVKKLGGKLLGKHSAMMFNSNAYPGIATVEPFTVVTVVDGDLRFENQDVDENIHRFLEAVTNWRRDFDTLTELPSLEDRQILTKKASARKNHVLYGDKHGRVVWFPATFKEKSEIQRTLTCYHRNLIMASMQTMALGDFLRQSLRVINSGKNLSSTHRKYIRWARSLLSDLQNGSSEVYKTRSIAKQMEQNEYSQYMQELANI